MGEVFVVWEGMNLLQSAAIALFFVWDALVYDIIAERFPSINRARQPHFVTDLLLLIYQKTSPKNTRAMQKRVLLGEVLGERGKFGGREPRLSRGGSLPPRSSSKVFLQGLPHFTYSNSKS